MTIDLAISVMRAERAIDEYNRVIMQAWDALPTEQQMTRNERGSISMPVRGQPEYPVKLPIVQVHFDGGTLFPATLHIGHPMTDVRYVYPLRAGQVVYFRLPESAQHRFKGVFRGVIADVGEHLVQLDTAITWYADPSRPSADGVCGLRDGEMLRLSVEVRSYPIP